MMEIKQWEGGGPIKAMAALFHGYIGIKERTHRLRDEQSSPIRERKRSERIFCFSQHSEKEKRERESRERETFICSVVFFLRSKQNKVNPARS